MLRAANIRVSLTKCAYVSLTPRTSKHVAFVWGPVFLTWTTLCTLPAGSYCSAPWDGKLRPFLRSIESHFLECQSKSGAVLPPLRNEPPICRPNDRGQPYNAVLSIHISRALHPATYVSGRSIWRILFERKGRQAKKRFLGSRGGEAIHGSDSEALRQINFLSLLLAKSGVGIRDNFIIKRGRRSAHISPRQTYE